MRKSFALLVVLMLVACSNHVTEIAENPKPTALPSNQVAENPKPTASSIVGSWSTQSLAHERDCDTGACLNKCRGMIFVPNGTVFCLKLVGDPEKRIVVGSWDAQLSSPVSTSCTVPVLEGYLGQMNCTQQNGTVTIDAQGQEYVFRVAIELMEYPFDWLTMHGLDANGAELNELPLKFISKRSSHDRVNQMGWNPYGFLGNKTQVIGHLRYDETLLLTSDDGNMRIPLSDQCVPTESLVPTQHYELHGALQVKPQSEDAIPRFWFVCNRPATAVA